MRVHNIPWHRAVQRCRPHDLVVLDSMHAEGYGLKQLRPHDHSAFKKTTFSFGDDTYLIQSVSSPSTAVADAQSRLDEWHDGLHVIEG